MLEELMSVWSSTAAAPAALPLVGSEGNLVSVSISVEPPRLEALLDALAHLDFPINPQLYHGAVVEFPAYEKRLPQIRAFLETCGFRGDTVSVAHALACRCGLQPTV
jgi:hypothetical protein